MPEADAWQVLSELGVTDPLTPVHLAATTEMSETKVLALPESPYPENTKFTPAHAVGIFEITKPLNLKLAGSSAIETGVDEKETGVDEGVEPVLNLPAETSCIKYQFDAVRPAVKLTG